MISIEVIIGGGISILVLVVSMILYSMKSIKSDLEKMDVKNMSRFNRVFERTDCLVQKVADNEVSVYKEFVTKDYCDKKHLKG